MKTLFRRAFVLILTAGFCAGAFAGQPVSDADVSKKLDQLNIAAQAIDIHLQHIFTALNTGAQSGACWLDGKAYSQGAEATTGGHAVTCGVQAKTGWPQWIRPGVIVN